MTYFSFSCLRTEQWVVYIIYCRLLVANEAVYGGVVILLRHRGMTGNWNTKRATAF